MQIIKEADFRKEIKVKPACGYLFYGDEDYMKGFAIKQAIEAIAPDPSFAFFNELRFDALSYTPEALLDALMPLPMMAERKIIIVTGLDLNAMSKSRSRDIEDLCSVLSQLEDYEYNTVIISVASDRFDPGSNPKRPSALLNKLGEYLTPVNFEKNTPARLSAWVGKHFEHNGVTATPDVCALLIERCGREMFILANEAEKVSYFVLYSGRSAVTREDVISVATPAAEYDAFALTNAIGARRRDEALDILRDLKLRRVEPIVILGQIASTVCDMASIATLKNDGLTAAEISSALKMHEFRVSMMLKSCPRLDICQKMLIRCNDADLEMKSSWEGYSVIEKLICTI